MTNNPMAVKRLKLLCKKLGLEAAIPDEVYSDPEGLFAIFGQMRGKIDELLSASKPAAPEGWMRDVLAYLEEGIETPGPMEAEHSIEARRLIATAPATPAQSACSWEHTAVANELWQLADQCGYEQFHDALTAHIKKAYQDGWEDHRNGVASVTYGDEK